MSNVSSSGRTRMNSEPTNEISLKVSVEFPPRLFPQLESILMLWHAITQENSSSSGYPNSETFYPGLCDQERCLINGPHSHRKLNNGTA